MNLTARLRILAFSVIPFLMGSSAWAGALDPNAYSTLGSLSVASGTLTFDTDTLTVTGGGGLGSTLGVLQPQAGGPDIAVFTFDSVSIGSGVTFQVTGSRPVAVLSRSNLIVDSNVTLSGAAGANGEAFPSPAPSGGNGENGAQSSIGGNGAPQTVATEYGGRGGNGGYNNGSGTAGTAGSGGAGGGPGAASSGQLFVKSGNGGPGIAGANGPSGSPGGGGAAPSVGGAFVLAGGDAGQSGANGLNGKGGGGGGGGGGGSSLFNGFPAGNADTGGGGGAGGSGGLGGRAGQGGAGGAAVEFVAVGTASFSGSLSAAGGNGGNGSAGQLGGSGGQGGAGFDDSGDGGRGGNGGTGGYGGPGGGGTGGTIFVSGSQVHLPNSLIELGGGVGGLNDIGSIAGSGRAGLFKLDGTLVLDVEAVAVHDRLYANGLLDVSGGVLFSLANEEIADAFSSSFTFYDFFFSYSNPLSDLSPFQALHYSAVSPTRQFDVTLNPDLTFTLTAVPEPSTIALAIGGALALCIWRLRRAVRGNAHGRLASLVIAAVVLSSAIAQAANPLPDGYISATGMDDSPATLVQPGYYASDDHTQAIPASPGSYIPNSGAQGASSQIPAPLGAFVATSGASSYTPAAPGYYVNTTGATAQTPAPLGAFVATSGASSYTPAAPGYYVSTIGATSQTPAPLGTYVPTSGAFAPTPAAPGHYVSTIGASAQTPAPLGTYVPTSGAFAPTPAAPGTYVPTTGATSALDAPRGYFVAMAGQSAPTPAPVGYYVPSIGATAALPAPLGTTAPEIASYAVRSSDPLVSRGGDVVGPIFDSITAPNDLIALGTIATPTSFTLDLKNISSDLGFASLLTDLSILSFSITGSGAGDVSVLNWTGAFVLHEGDSYLLQLQVAPSAAGTFSPMLTIFTDEFAPVGTAGASYSYPIQFSAVPEPSTIVLSLFGVLGAAAMLRRGRRLRRR